MKVALIDSGIGDNDANGHGSAMAFIIRAICPLANIVDLKIFDENGESTYLTLIEKINEAFESGCHVLNMSLSRKPTDSVQLNQTIDELEEEIVRRLAIASRLRSHTFIAAGNLGLPIAQKPAYFSRLEGMEYIFCVSACEENSDIISPGSSCKEQGICFQIWKQ